MSAFLTWWPAPILKFGSMEALLSQKLALVKKRTVSFWKEFLIFMPLDRTMELCFTLGSIRRRLLCFVNGVRTRSEAVATIIWIWTILNPVCRTSWRISDQISGPVYTLDMVYQILDYIRSSTRCYSYSCSEAGENFDSYRLKQLTGYKCWENTSFPQEEEE